MLQSQAMFMLLNEGGSTHTAVQNVLDQVPDVISLMITTMTNLLNNPFFAFLFAFGFVRIGMSLIRKAKKASR